MTFSQSPNPNRTEPNPTRNFHPVDGEYKQKSATQTPSGHLSTTSEVEISCKPGSTSGTGIVQANSADSGTYQSSKVSRRQSAKLLATEKF